MHDQLYSFLANEEIITNQQSGFHSLHFTVTALLDATDSWAFNIDCHNANAVVFLDLKKAFDIIDHDVLLAKLSLYRIQESAYDWFKYNRTHQKIMCCQWFAFQSLFTAGCGVPRGTIVGPLLFLIYVNNLTNCLLSCQPRMYADHTHITYAIPDLTLNAV